MWLSTAACTDVDQQHPIRRHCIDVCFTPESGRSAAVDFISARDLKELQPISRSHQRPENGQG
jgi:hypothetical protein